MKNLITVYLLLINAAGFAFMLIDKYKARKKLWRIRERTLLTVAFLGGGIGSLFGMLIANHKTRHPKFMVTVPLFSALQVIILIALKKYWI